jgi:prepilin-type processing-associated H-X9-DG protein/prepilin-type N-terminal cleavage/methylation domain-containing protein
MQNLRRPFASGKSLGLSPGYARSAAFTLIELLVVIAILVVLAGLLLPGLSRAKAAGQSAVCKSNLHQLGIALNLYTDDGHRFPVWAVDGTPPIFWDDRLLPSVANNRKVFLCPSNKQAPAWTNSLLGPNPSYGYNMAGVGTFRFTIPSLGLDGTTGIDPFAATPLLESQVRAPADMIALCDYRRGANDGNFDEDDFPVNLLECLPPPRHNLGANVGFCDGHVEYAKQAVLLQNTASARQRWNNDHQPHLGPGG